MIGRAFAFASAFVLVLGVMLPAWAEPRLPATEQPLPEPHDKPKQAVQFHVEVMVLYASNSSKGIDPRIGNMPELRRPPFSSYKSYEFVARARLPLVKGKPEKLVLPDQRTVRTELLEVLTRDQIRLSASVSQGKRGAFLPLLEVKASVGQAFIVAGQNYKEGVLVLVFRVVKG